MLFCLIINELSATAGGAAVSGVAPGQKVGGDVVDFSLIDKPPRGGSGVRVRGKTVMWTLMVGDRV